MFGEIQEMYKSLLCPAGLVTFWRLYILGLQAGDLDTQELLFAKISFLNEPSEERVCHDNLFAYTLSIFWDFIVNA